MFHVQHSSGNIVPRFRLLTTILSVADNEVHSTTNDLKPAVSVGGGGALSTVLSEPYPTPPASWASPPSVTSAHLSPNNNNSPPHGIVSTTVQDLSPDIKQVRFIGHFRWGESRVSLLLSSFLNPPFFLDYLHHFLFWKITII